ncbi:hypothetical protein BDN70DRAFT_701651 [Pholiota conissans]|uniref:EGF-like domain-containing protein n=1 Tax=Pholiota conissans TaxID=109636 RepID=A0A9P6CU66_9AGAR|nr:hypothetical protein BDN70DRAFT_701651 [Pholiota conissans]
MINYSRNFYCVCGSGSRGVYCRRCGGCPISQTVASCSSPPILIQFSSPLQTCIPIPSHLVTSSYVLYNAATPSFATLILLQPMHAPSSNISYIRVIRRLSASAR